MSYSTWQHSTLVSPYLEQPISVLAARDVPYILTNSHKLQTLNIYTLPTGNSISPKDKVISLPNTSSYTSLPTVLVHIHGGAWRDPNLLASSIEAAAAHAFSYAANNADNHHLTTIISLNYTLSPFPKHPSQPYDGSDNSQPWRSARHPDHITDILHAFAFLRDMGLEDGRYILSGHSAGSCLAFQASLFSAKYWSDKTKDIPRPAALLGMNGLYGLPELVYGLGSNHANLQDVYADLIGIAFGKDENEWSKASPLHLETQILEERIGSGKAPKLIIIDQSTEDQLVPMNQATAMKEKLKYVHGLEVVTGKRCTGAHAAPWEQGYMIWENVKDILELLQRA